jgi:antirestriction protein
MRIAAVIGVLFSTIVDSAPELDGKTGLVIAPGFDVVSVQCTVCHSALLVTQNRASRAGWENMIRWMQDTQGLWPLGEQEGLVLDYLAEYYGPQSQGRRAPLAENLLPPFGS